MNGLLKILFVGLGGAIGSILRYLLALSVPLWMGRIYLWGTLSVNVIGSFLIGLTWAFFEQNTISTNFRLFIFIGLLGGFTTFSSFSLEIINLFRDVQTKTAMIYILGTNFLAITIALGGYAIMKNLVA